MQPDVDDQNTMTTSEVEQVCAPCDVIDFSGLDSVNINECNPELLSTESFTDCSDVCERMASRNTRRGSQRRSRSEADVDVKENCRCLCKSLKLVGRCPGKLS